MYRPAGNFSKSYSDELSIIQHREHWVLIILSGLFLILSFCFASSYMLSIFNLAFITIIAALGLQILVGFTGQISVAHGAFMAVGAFTTAILSSHSVPIPFSIILASVLTACIGLLIGWPSVRIKGFYLLMTTFAAQTIIIYAIQTPFAGITLGTLGHSAPSLNIFGLHMNTERRWFILLALILCFATILVINLKRSKGMRALIAIRDNELAAEVMGINLKTYKLFSFFVSCLFAGLAGALYAHWQGLASVEPFGLMRSIWFLGYLFIGGIGSISGCFFGVAFFFVLEETLSAIFLQIGIVYPGVLLKIASVKTIVFGLAMAAFLIYEPRGLSNRWGRFKAYYRVWPFPSS